MKLGIMQPYFFPYIGYFQLINYTDKWVVFDNVQYINRGWMNRNRIIHPNKPETIYITVPVVLNSRDDKINEVIIHQDGNYINKILSQLTSSYKKRAPYFKVVYDLVENVLNGNQDKLCDLNVYSLKTTCEYLNINFDYSVYSKMDIDIDEVNGAGDWALNISKAMGADAYVNPPGGIEIFDKKAFEDSNIELEFLQAEFVPYKQKKPTFFEGLSIIDIMMFNSPEEIKGMLDKYKII